MSFISKFISGKKVLVVDVGTYKVKAAYCEYKNSDVSILGYAEKRQETSHVIASEIANIEGVSNTIEDVIIKALAKANYTPKDIIINIPTSTLVTSANKIAYSRSQRDTPVDLNELDFIVSKTESKALEDAKREITKKTGYLEVDMKLITSSITSIKIDNFAVSNPIGFTGENVLLSTLNIFIPASRYSMIQMIGNFLNKKILSIVPLEFSLPKLLESSEMAYDDVVFVDIGNTKTSLIVQKKGVLEGISKVDIGMNDLIKKIKESHNIPRLEIIKNIDNPNLYLKEKQDFLNVWSEGCIISLKEILKGNPSPYKFFLSGGGDNQFIREKISNINFAQEGIPLPKSVEFITHHLEEQIQTDIPEIFDKTNLGLLSMILATKEVVNYKNNPVLNVLKDFIEKNEF